MQKEEEKASRKDYFIINLSYTGYRKADFS
jgi:hypothetical protein